MAWSADEPALVLRRVSRETGEPIDYVRRVIRLSRAAIDEMAADGWAIVIAPMTWSMDPNHEVLKILEEKLEDTLVDPPAAGLDDYEELASYLGIALEAFDDTPLGGEGVVLAHMIDELGLPEGEADRAGAVLYAWVDTFVDSSGRGLERRYEFDPRATGHLRPAVLSGKRDFVALLRDWLESEPAPTVGTGGRQALVRIDIGEVEAKLASDTTLEAVRGFIQHWDETAGSEPWYVTTNAKGKVNKVSFRSEPVKGWYFYLTEPWGQPGRL